MSTGSTALQAQYEELKARGLALDLTRGKPSPEQLDLSSQLLSIDLARRLPRRRRHRSAQLRRLPRPPRARELFGELLGVPAAQLLAGNTRASASCTTSSRTPCCTGSPGRERPWRDDDVAFLCPVPGYDRHFTILEALGIRMIAGAARPRTTGPTWRRSRDLVATTRGVKGMWIVPMYSEPDRRTLDDAAARELASLPAAAPDFRLFWDNAYAVHHLTDTSRRPTTSSGSRPRRATRIARSCSPRRRRSRSPAPASPSSPRRRPTSTGTASTAPCSRSDPTSSTSCATCASSATPRGCASHMRAHREIIAPKFAAVERILSDGLSGHARWTHPKGGYFVTLEAPEGTATPRGRAGEGGRIAVTPAGSPYPYGDDPRDSVIRLAPTMPAWPTSRPRSTASAPASSLAEEERGASPVRLW